MSRFQQPPKNTNAGYYAPQPPAQAHCMKAAATQNFLWLNALSWNRHPRPPITLPAPPATSPATTASDLCATASPCMYTVYTVHSNFILLSEYNILVRPVQSVKSLALDAAPSVGERKSHSTHVSFRLHNI